jgi:hypothetical protein
VRLDDHRAVMGIGPEQDALARGRNEVAVERRAQRAGGGK